MVRFSSFIILKGFLAAFLAFSVLNVGRIGAQSHEYFGVNFEGSTLLGVFEIDNQIVCVEGNGLNVPLELGQEYAIVFYSVEINTSSNQINCTEYHRIELESGFQVFAIDYIEDAMSWIMVLANNMDDPEGEKIFRVQVYDIDFHLKLEGDTSVIGAPNYFYFDTYHYKTSMIGYVFEAGRDKLVYLEYWHESIDSLTQFKIDQTNPKPTFWLTSMKFDQYTGHMLIAYYNGIAILDSTLFQIANYNYLSGITTSDHGSAIRDGNFYFTHGSLDSAWDDGRRRLVLQKFDTTFNVISADTLGWHLWDNYPFIVVSIDIRDDIILVGGMLDGPFNDFNFFDRRKKFYLARYNLDVKQHWYKEYGGNLAYTINGLKLLESGGSMAYGFITDTLSFIRYSYLLYVDENGDIISSHEIPPALGPPLTLVNPGADQLTILNPTALQARIIVSSLDGREILNTTFQSETVSYDMHDLPSGMYPYVFYIDDRPVKSGKWVKK